MIGDHTGHKLVVTYYEERLEVYTFEDGQITNREGDDYPTPVDKLDIDCLTCGLSEKFDINETTPDWVKKIYERIINSWTKGGGTDS